MYFNWVNSELYTISSFYPVSHAPEKVRIALRNLLAKTEGLAGAMGVAILNRHQYESHWKEVLEELGFVEKLQAMNYARSLHFFLKPAVEPSAPRPRLAGNDTRPRTSHHFCDCCGAVLFNLLRLRNLERNWDVVTGDNVDSSRYAHPLQFAVMPHEQWDALKESVRHARFPVMEMGSAGSTVLVGQATTSAAKRLW